MSTSGRRTCAAAVLAGVLALSAVAVFHRAHARETPRQTAALVANLADTVAPTGRVEQPGVAPAPAAIMLAAGAGSVVAGVDSTVVTPIRTTSESGRGPPAVTA